MTLYSYQELREALDKASIVCKNISINGDNTLHWYYDELDDLQAIINALPEKTDYEQEANKNRSDAWAKVIEHPFFYSERWGSKPILEAVLEKLDELVRGPLPTEYGSAIKNAVIQSSWGSKEEYPIMQLSNIGWMGVTEDGVFSGGISVSDIISWEPCSE